MNRVILSVLILSCVPAILCVSDEFKELAAMLHNTCVGKTGVNEELIVKVNTEKVMVDDENLKCYIKCTLDEMAAIDDDGTVDVEAVVAMLPEEMRVQVEPTIRKCGAKKGANPCESAWLTQKCYLEEKPDAYILL